METKPAGLVIAALIAAVVVLSSWSLLAQLVTVIDGALGRLP
jgi:hypothetical protein